MIRVLLVTSWGENLWCGIAEHSKALIASVRQADSGIEIVPSAESLDPHTALTLAADCDLIHLNYHRALHSRWTTSWINAAHIGNGNRRWPVVITFHDTFGEAAPDTLSQDLCAIADAFVVHEPCLSLERVIYWRMGIPEDLGWSGLAPRDLLARTYLGTCGFDFPWKNYDELARLTAEIGWGLVIACPTMPKARVADLTALNPHLVVHQGLAEQDLLATLRMCDATAFTYTCGNSGQSGAILQGIGARKPVYALESCRQFRALRLADAPIRWVQNFEDLKLRLYEDPLVRLDPKIVDWAERDSWTKLGQKYAGLYRSLVV